MIFGGRKVKCVFCEKPTPRKTAYTIRMNTADGQHSVFACEPCADDFDKMASYLEKNLDKRTYTI